MKKVVGKGLVLAIAVALGGCNTDKIKEYFIQKTNVMGPSADEKQKQPEVVPKKGGPKRAICILSKGVNEGRVKYMTSRALYDYDDKKALCYDFNLMEEKFPEVDDTCFCNDQAEA